MTAPMRIAEVPAETADVHAQVAKLADLRARAKRADDEATRLAGALAQLRERLAEQEAAQEDASDEAGGALLASFLNGSTPKAGTDSAALAAALETRRLHAAIKHAEHRHATLLTEAADARAAAKEAIDAVANAELDACKPRLLEAWRCYQSAWHRYLAAADSAGAYVTRHDAETVEHAGGKTEVQRISDLLVVDTEVAAAAATLRAPKLRAEGRG